MTIERPISTIRKAINSAAQNKAENEFLEKPEQKHYEDIFSEYKLLRAFEPELLEKLLILGAEGSEIKHEMGSDLYEIFSNVQEELTSIGKEKLINALEQIKKTKNLSLEELNQEIANLNNSYLKIKGEEIKNDPRIKSAFNGKERLLDNAISFSIKSLVDIGSIYVKTLNIKTLNSIQEMYDKMQRVKRGKPTAKELKELEKGKLS